MLTQELKSKLTKTIDFLKSELSQVRTGRANPALLEDLTIEAYQAKMALKELGSLTLGDAHTILFSPWDKSLLGVISTAIRDSEHKLNPIEVGNNLRIPIPALTEERRKELTKVVSQKVEECKQALRSIRQEAMKDIDKDFEEKSISEDEKFSTKEDVEKIIKEFSTQADELGAQKSKELLTV